MLPLASISLTASMSSFGGRLKPERRLGGLGDGVNFRETLGSTELAAEYAPNMTSGVTGGLCSPVVNSDDGFADGGVIDGVDWLSFKVVAPAGGKGKADACI